MAKTPKEPKEAKPLGRPSKFTEVDLDKVRSLAIKGWTDDEMSAFFEVDRSTWYRWKANFPDFCDALKDWKAEADARVERSLYHKAVGYSSESVKVFLPAGAEDPIYAPYVEHHAPDTTAAIFWLKNRRSAEWRDRQEHEHTIVSHEERLEKLRQKTSDEG